MVHSASICSLRGGLSGTATGIAQSYYMHGYCTYRCGYRFSSRKRDESFCVADSGSEVEDASGTGDVL